MKSRTLVLDAAERVMAADGFEAATIARIVDEAGVPLSSVYHYYGSKDGVLLAVMARGAERFFTDLPDPDHRLGRPANHLRAVVLSVGQALERHPHFLRLLVEWWQANIPKVFNYEFERTIAKAVLKTMVEIPDMANGRALTGKKNVFRVIRPSPALGLGHARLAQCRIGSVLDEQRSRIQIEEYAAEPVALTRCGKPRCDARLAQRALDERIGGPHRAQ